MRSHSVGLAGRGVDLGHILVHASVDTVDLGRAGETEIKRNLKLSQHLFKASLRGEEGRHLHRPSSELADAKRRLALVQQVSCGHLAGPVLSSAHREVDDITICSNRQERQDELRVLYISRS